MISWHARGHCCARRHLAAAPFSHYFYPHPAHSAPLRQGATIASGCSLPLEDDYCSQQGINRIEVPKREVQKCSHRMSQCIKRPLNSNSIQISMDTIDQRHQRTVRGHAAMSAWLSRPIRMERNYQRRVRSHFGGM